MPDRRPDIVAAHLVLAVPLGGVGIDDSAPSTGLAPAGGDCGLSTRELEVLTLIAQGCTNAQIADLLLLSVNSIKTYSRTAYHRIGVTRRSQAVLWCIRQGLGAPMNAPAPAPDESADRLSAAGLPIA